MFGSDAEGIGRRAFGKLGQGLVIRIDGDTRNFEIAIEFQRSTCSPEHGAGGLVGSHQPHIQKAPAGVGHLAGQESAANQVVDLPVFFAHTFEVFPFHGGVGGPNGFVRFLGPITLGGIVPGFVGKVGLTVGLVDQGAGHLDRFGGQPGRIGSHVGDVPVLIQLLGDAHGALGSEAQET